MRTLQTSSPAALSLGPSTIAATAPLLAASASGRVNSNHFSQQHRVDQPTENSVGSFMNISRTLALLLVLAALVGLGGCSTVSPDRMLVLFETGEQPLYGVVGGKPRKIHELSNYSDFKKTCGRQTNFGDATEPLFNEWLAKNVCDNMDKWQYVPLVYHTKVWGMKGLKLMRAYAPVEWNIEEDDILELSMDISKEGRFVRPPTVKRIARKAKDATKESGCWWDGGKGASSAFISGGAVCDGWNWKNQKFANE